MTTLISLATTTLRGDTPPDGPGDAEDPARAGGASCSGARPKVDALVRSEFRFVWRLLRRLGLPDGDADDATQQVFLIASRRLADIRPGRERSFLYTTALHVASKAKRATARRREDFDTELEGEPARGEAPDEALDQRRARALLDELLAKLPLELRVVLVLHEIDELSAAEIAEVVGIPAGTAASRLRRARETFARELSRFSARQSFLFGFKDGAKP